MFSSVFNIQYFRCESIVIIKNIKDIFSQIQIQGYSLNEYWIKLFSDGIYRNMDSKSNSLMAYKIVNLQRFNSVENTRQKMHSNIARLSESSIAETSG